MDKKIDCLWKSKNNPTKCTYPGHEYDKCHCDLEPCKLYEKKKVFNVLKKLIIKSLYVL